MKTRVALLAVTLCLSALFSRAADPVIDALVAQIQSNPAGAPAAVAQAASANQALASDIFKAAFEAAPNQVAEILKTSVAANPDLAPAAVEQALVKLTAGLSADAASKVAADTTAAAIAAIPASTPADVKSKLVSAIVDAASKVVPGAEAAIADAAGKSSPEAADVMKKRKLNSRNFPHQRPPIIVSPSR